MEDVGLEPGSVVSELGGFSVKEAKFRREMEKLRNQQNRDLSFTKVISFASGIVVIFQKLICIILRDLLLLKIVLVINCTEYL